MSTTSGSLETRELGETEEWSSRGRILVRKAVLFKELSSGFWEGVDWRDSS